MRLTWTVWMYLMVGLGYAAHEYGLHPQQGGGAWLVQIACWPAAVVEHVLDQEHTDGQG